ncbi:MAG: nucleotidyltransferase family protein [Proteobacteria bacterium]|nr:nucleotidyltransferase family protein [Pseudomonadota bacterium]MBU4470557.1 nucleotidyltransferase family protein [Pseudomonadota bacterium]MCG2751393.1 nucleotidyltransferase family protein [Desulfobacteraceae bacterium]
MKKNEIITILRDYKKQFATQYGILDIGVFGSAARDEMGEHSDVDILVEFAEPTFDHFMDLKFRLEEIFQRPVDLVIKDTVKPRIKPIIEQEVVYA